MCTAADRHVLDRADWLLLRVYHFELLNSTFFEFTTHNFCQRADGCFVDVCYLKSSRVEFVSGSHTADDRNAGFFGFHDELDLCSYGIYCIYNIIILGKVKLILGFWKVEAFVDINFCLWVDVEDAVFHNIDFVFADSASGGDDLTVQVGEADFVIIDQIKFTNSTSHKCLYGITADSTDSKNGNSGVRQFLHGFFTK